MDKYKEAMDLVYSGDDLDYELAMMDKPGSRTRYPELFDRDYQKGYRDGLLARLGRTRELLKQFQGLQLKGLIAADSELNGDRK